MSSLRVGGFLPLTTIDFPGRLAAVVFCQGCPWRCSYCHNPQLIPAGAEAERPWQAVLDFLERRRGLLDGVVFSGGEPTLQGPALAHLAAAARKMGFSVGLHTNGIFPRVIEDLLDRGILDMISLDIKTTWEHYDDLLELTAADAVKQSLAVCKRAKVEGRLLVCDVVVTLFRGRESDLPSIARDTRGLDLVLQQGVAPGYVPLTRQELEAAAAPLGRRVRIRTREDGEITYDPEP